MSSHTKGVTEGSELTEYDREEGFWNKLKTNDTWDLDSLKYTDFNRDIRQYDTLTDPSNFSKMRTIYTFLLSNFLQEQDERKSLNYAHVLYQSINHKIMIDIIKSYIQGHTSLTDENRTRLKNLQQLLEQPESSNGNGIIYRSLFVFVYNLMSMYFKNNTKLEKFNEWHSWDDEETEKLKKLGPNNMLLTRPRTMIYLIFKTIEAYRYEFNPSLAKAILDKYPLTKHKSKEEYAWKIISRIHDAIMCHGAEQIDIRMHSKYGKDPFFAADDSRKWKLADNPEEATNKFQMYTLKRVKSYFQISHDQQTIAQLILSHGIILDPFQLILLAQSQSRNDIVYIVRLTERTKKQSHLQVSTKALASLFVRYCIFIYNDLPHDADDNMVFILRRLTEIIRNFPRIIFPSFVEDIKREFESVKANLANLNHVHFDWKSGIVQSVTAAASTIYAENLFLKNLDILRVRPAGPNPHPGTGGYPIPIAPNQPPPQSAENRDTGPQAQQPHV
jgi:hypothetical protein